jgi:SET domain-containing protein
VSADDPNSLKIYVQPTPEKGRGVFARRRIRRKELIERSPVIVVPRQQWPTIARTVLANYVFDWGEEQEDAAMALGYVSIYNHSYRPNAELTECVDDRMIEVSALRDIQPGEEIFVNYNGEPGDKDELWFDVVDGRRPKNKGVINAWQKAPARPHKSVRERRQELSAKKKRKLAAQKIANGRRTPVPA